MIWEGNDLKYKVSGISHPGKVRNVNQDNFYCDERFRALEHGEFDVDGIVSGSDGWLAAVFDGMGGEKYGEIASLIAAKATHEVCTGAVPPYDIETLINYTNSKVCQEIEDRRSSMGSTCVYMEFDGSRCRSWNLGDSRSYLVHDGSMEQLSEDHTEASSYRAVFGETAVHHGSENRLTQHLGIPSDEFIIEPYVSPWYALNEGDQLLLCSDGLCHYVNDGDICSVLTSPLSIQEKRNQLLEMALNAGGKDNITVLVIEAVSDDNQ